MGQCRDMFLKNILKQNVSEPYTQKCDANRLMNYGDLEPPQLPTLNALRVIKYKTCKNICFVRILKWLYLCFKEPFLIKK